MKKLLNIFGYGLMAVLTVILGLIAYVKTMLPNVGSAPDLKVEITSQKIDRGKYLANHVMLCIDCHSTRDWSLFSGPIIPGTEGKGGESFDQKLGFPGKYVAPNITPFYLQNWTDGEMFRAITAGVSKDGRALFPIMPHHLYGQLDKNDIEAVIAYIRNLRSIESETEVSNSDFPMNFIINTIPKKPTFRKIPVQSDTLNYGKYMITAAGCMDCHTKQVRGEVVGDPYAGGFEFKLQDGSVVRSANLTPDKITGLGNWTSEQFINRFKKYTENSYVNPKIARGEFQTTMPWTVYSGMNKGDLEAIFCYLQSLKAVKNQIEKFTPSK
ncbi:MAG: c-type cytochrome [Saprospiraceae bacterium]|nr:c-type cytochrome [Saprospiraceae bacterium]MBK7787325.1 c-type cytochrome [Saprospiraceae bacterium]MBK8109867.1 c-type cytochrome [Saprospiraceae bacterium]MBK8849372.1 c-type cytochrome [Saprospiraceae bacterium]MBK9686774.1 c-type cytochrome [Saprospiraceae bacterium]